MFIVSSTTQMANYSVGFGKAVTSAAAGVYPMEVEFANEAADEMSMHFHHSQKNSTSSAISNGSGGGLRRSLSSMHGSLDSYCPPNASTKCSHSNGNQHCIVEAKQVEIDFSNLCNDPQQLPFELSITAPNGECSRVLFEHFEQRHQFCPVKEGCGHGDWTVRIEGKGMRSISLCEDVYLDGVGSLFFTIDEGMNIRLDKQEFLRLPSASQCCSNGKK